MADRDSHPIEAIHALVDGRLAPSEREAVERHMEGCASCRAELEVAAGWSNERSSAPVESST